MPRIVDYKNGNGFHYEDPNDMILSEYWVDFNTTSVMASNANMKRGKALMVYKGLSVFECLARLREIRKFHAEMIEQAAYLSIGD